jgi:hypothetical protein
MSRYRTILCVIIYVAVLSFLTNVLLNVRQDFVDNSSRMSQASVKGYDDYYEKWEEKRLEGAKIFIRMAHEPQFALAVIDPLVVLCIFLMACLFGQSFYYELRHAKLLNKKGNPTASLPVP